MFRGGTINVDGTIDRRGNIFEAARRREYPMPPLRWSDWHEKMATEPVEHPISVKDGKAEANHAFKAEAAMGPAEAKDVVLASSSGEKCDACCKTDKAAAIQKTASK